jgi:hypothetical protein
MTFWSASAADVSLSVARPVGLVLTRHDPELERRARGEERSTLRILEDEPVTHGDLLHQATSTDALRMT